MSPQVFKFLPFKYLRLIRDASHVGQPKNNIRREGGVECLSGGGKE
jgi:hypothetical protein